MPAFPILHVDAFSDTPLYGIPVTVVLDADRLTESQMQAIAHELNLGETSFVFPSDHADFTIRFFGPTSEILMPGHLVIATAHALAETDRWVPDTDRPMQLETKHRIIAVACKEEDLKARWVMTQPRPEWGTVYSEDVIAPALGLTPEEVMAPPQTVSTGILQLMVPVRNLNMVARAAPNLERLAQLAKESDFFSVQVFTLGGNDPRADVYVRDFSPVSTDAKGPVGSLGGAIAAYLMRYHLVQQRTFIAEYDLAIGRPSIVYVRVLGSGREITGVEVGGQAVTVLRGELTL